MSEAERQKLIEGVGKLMGLKPDPARWKKSRRKPHRARPSPPRQDPGAVNQPGSSGRRSVTGNHESIVRIAASTATLWPE